MLHGRYNMEKKLCRKYLVIGAVISFLLVNITPSALGIFGIDKSFDTVYDNGNFNLKVMKESGLKSEGGNFKFGFVFGQFASIESEDDLLVITAEDPYLYCILLNPFSIRNLYWGDQIKITQFKIGIVASNFIIAFCRIFMPQAEISMQVSSHNESENLVIWEVDDINGDPIWMSNLVPSLFNESGDFFSFIYEPVIDKYLSVGDQIKVTAEEDGYYYFKITERVSGDILFESDLVKY